MSRISRDELGLELAAVWAKRATCARRKVGCVLVDADGHELSTGYNGPASGQAHCTETPCPGVAFKSGEGLDSCEAIHAEQNAIAFCPDPRRVHTCYTTVSPCVSCLKLLLNTSCRRLVFAEEYPHSSAKELWLRAGREWLYMPSAKAEK